MSLSKAQVEHVARLARLTLTEDEKERYAEQLNRILEHMEQLAKLNTQGVEPTYHVLPLQNVLRMDEPHAGLKPEEALAAAPAAEQGCFKVPKIAESGNS
jgi:aspartyl-tRNA(Asn)/glutamyl-tRNA(Gln) amidotransferase subunit C